MDMKTDRETQVRQRHDLTSEQAFRKLPAYVPLVGAFSVALGTFAFFVSPADSYARKASCAAYASIYALVCYETPRDFANTEPTQNRISETAR